MKLQEKNLEEWDGTYKVIYQNETRRILLLSFPEITEFKPDGRSNLFCVDDSFEIIWQAEIPTIGGVGLCIFDDVKFENGILTGWYGGSTLVKLNARDGKIITEDFVK